jgi:hypothetical protein
MAITTYEIINYLQLTANTFALGIAGWIYLAFIKNLKSTIQLKDEQIKTVEKNMTFLKDKIAEMEKKTPENMEKILSERIKIREEEIIRLKGDKQNHDAELGVKDEQLIRLKSELEKTKDIRRTMDLLELSFDDEEEGFFSSDAEYEIEEMGFVAVDSGQLMITDPCYIDSEWQDQPFKDIRLVRDVQTEQVYQFRKDFQNYESKISGFDETVNELIKSGRFESVEVDHSEDITYSYSGACYATTNDKGYGVLPFKLGHEGAGIAVRTVLGDGMYPVYAEKYDGKIVRVYFNLL